MNGERARFLAENDFNIAISLDGSKKEHDTCRKFPDGSGSFDTVMQNIRDLSRSYPEYTKKSVSFFTTVNPFMDLGCVMEYFKADEIINEKHITYNMMVLKDLKNKQDYQESFFQIQKFEYIKALFSLIGKLDKKEISPLVYTSINYAKKTKQLLHRKSELSPIVHPGGPCMPGILRLFARYDGALFPCERVNENRDFYCIGTVEEGLFLDRMRDILNIGKLTEEECKTCWNLRRCSMCSNEIEFHGNERPGKEDKLKLCREKKGSAEGELYEQSVLKEFGYITKPGEV